MTEAFTIQLPERGLITVEGRDRKSFLQGLVSNDVSRTEDGSAIWAAVLSPQGKFRHDFLLFEEGERFFLDCEGGERLMDLGKTLRRFVLRDDVKLGMDTGRRAFQIYGTDALSCLGLESTPGAARPLAGGTVFTDPRDASLGARLIAPEADARSLFAERGIAEGRLAEWDAVRIAHGIPDGSRDMLVDKALLMESGFDELGGVDWKKGCYMGQELTARTKYRGLVKKRLLPVTFDGAAPEPGTPIECGGKSVGEIRSAVEGRAMALIRLDGLAKSRQSGDPLTADGRTLSVEVPDWVKLPEEA